MGEGFLPFAPARSERGELWAAPLLVLLASSRRTTARAADGHGRRGVLSHVLLEALYLRGFFPPLKLFRWCFVSCFFSSSSSPVRASRGQGEPHDASSLHRENDGRGGVTDDHLCR